ncbi:MAG: hypothetical protein AAFR76_12820 [Planctomycetota bacterium]
MKHSGFVITPLVAWPAVSLIVCAAPLSAQPAESPPGAIIYPAIINADGAPFSMAGDDRRVIVANTSQFTPSGADEYAIVFDRLTGEELHVFEPDRPIETTEYASAATLWEDLAFVSGRIRTDDGSRRGFVDVFDLNTGQRIDTLSAPGNEPGSGDSDRFGFYLEAAGGRLAVADPFAGYPGESSGQIVVYALPDLTVLYELNESNTTLETFATELALSDEHLVTIRGFPEDIGSTGASLLVFDAATGAQLAQANPVVDGETITVFLGDLAVSDRYALAANVNSSRGDQSAGEVYVFDLQQLAFVSSFTPQPPARSWSMGAGMAVQGSVAVVSSPQTQFVDETGRIDVVSLPTGTVLNSIEAFERPDFSGFPAVERFGQAVELAAGGVLVSSWYFFMSEGRVDWIPINELCPADSNRDGLLSLADLGAWIIAYSEDEDLCDQNQDSACTPNDFNSWILNFNAGC